jgi:hypothetical protein
MGTTKSIKKALRREANEWQDRDSANGEYGTKNDVME